MSHFMPTTGQAKYLSERQIVWGFSLTVSDNPETSGKMSCWFVFQPTGQVLASAYGKGEQEAFETAYKKLPQNLPTSVADVDSMQAEIADLKAKLAATEQAKKK